MYSIYIYSIIAPTTIVVWLFIDICAFVLFVLLFYLLSSLITLFTIVPVVTI